MPACRRCGRPATHWLLTSDLGLYPACYDDAVTVWRARRRLGLDATAWPFTDEPTTATTPKGYQP